MSYFHPDRMPVLPARRRKAARQQLEQVVAQAAKSRARRHPVVIAAAIAIVVLSTGAAAAGVVAYEAVTHHAQARCFTVDDVTSNDFTLIAQASKPLTGAEARRRARHLPGAVQDRHAQEGPCAYSPVQDAGSSSRAWFGGLCLAGPDRGSLPWRAGNLRESRPPSGSTAAVRPTPPAARHGGPDSLSQIGAAVPY